MAHVVAEPCFGCKDTDCVSVCPADCFHEGNHMLYIHPEQCIDCEACVPVCPADAIYREDRLPIEWRPFIDLNATMANQSVRKRSENGLKALEQRQEESDTELAAQVAVSSGK